MNLSGKIHLLTSSVAALAGIILVAFVGHREMTYRQESLLLHASGLITSRPQLQQTFYAHDGGEMASLLNDVFDLSPAVKYVALQDTSGEILGSKQRSWAALDSIPDFRKQRVGLSPLDTGTRSIPGGSVPEGLALLRLLTFGEKSIAVTLPVPSLLNPLTPDLTAVDFAQAMVEADRVRSLFVTGYVHLGVSRTVLWSQSLPTVALYGAIALLLVLVLSLMSRNIARRITAPVRALADVSYDIAAGKVTEPLNIRGSSEIKEIAGVLNGIITGLHQYTRQMDTDKKILNLRVSEQSEQLTQRSQELDQAVRKVSETRDKLRHMAYFDELTSLPNRRLFTEQLALLLRLSARSKSRIGLLLVDIDNFKRINESLGTGSGDKLLREIADRLGSSIRDSDVVHRRAPEDGSIMDLSRLGGDEFTVVLNDVQDADAARTVAERIARQVAEPLRIEKQELMITATIGIALAPDHADSVEGLLTAAGAAAKAGKQRGRNRIVMFDKDLEGSNRDRLQLETDLRKATERDQLLLHYQPQVHSDDGKVVGAEALVRWKHPGLGLVPPFQWIPLAEELGMIHEVGNWVLREACQTLLSLREAGLALPKMSVNVSALQFVEGFVETVEQTLAQTGLEADSLELELTEGIMINDEDSTVRRVQQLKELGVRLSIDDFGTGYSSLSYLSRFPLDSLKIDRSFVLGLAEGSRNKDLVKAIISMGHSLGLDIVVEGVERLEELTFFREEDARVIQGYLFSAPVPVEKLRGLLKEGHFAGQLQVLDRILDHSLVSSMEQA